MKKRIVISGVNFFEGGPLSLMKDCLTFLEESDWSDRYEILSLVSSVNLYDDLKLHKVKLYEFPKARKNYFSRLYLEYFKFKEFAKKNNVDFWLSLHDISPNIGTIPQAVYCHNPSPFYKFSFRDFLIDPTFGLFTLLYKYLYGINIKRNRYVIVQQNWIRDHFAKAYNIDKSKIITAYPKINLPSIPTAKSADIKTFIFPTFPRVHKNIELIGEAIKKLKSRNLDQFVVLATIKGDENKYARKLYKKYGQLNELSFIGKQPREEIFNLYATSHYLLFPSKLETWGLPISEFKLTGKPILLSDLPYAHETLGTYDKALFFNPTNVNDLVSKMEHVLRNDHVKGHTYNNDIQEPKADGWNDLFKIILK